MATRDLKNLWDLIDSGNYKQASVKVNKELKKSPGNAYYTAVDAYISAKSGKKDDAMKSAQRVSDSNPTNMTILDLLRNVYITYGEDQKLNTIFESAVRQTGTNRDLLMMWLESMVDCNYIRGIMKACIEMQKRFPSRNNTLSVVYSMSLALQWDIVTQSEKKLFPVLCARHLEKLGDLTTGQEQYVKANFLKITGDHQVLISYLQSEQCRKSDLLELKIMLVESLKEAKDWKQLHSECIKFLGSKTLDNWLHWKLANEAAVELGGDTVDETRAFIEGFNSRNSFLARVDLASLTSSLSSSSISLNKALEQFFSRFGDKRSTFEDLKPYTLIPSLDRSQWRHFIAEKILNRSLVNQNCINIRVNAEKFLYLADFSDSFNPSDARAFLKRNIDFYLDSKPQLAQKDCKDYHSGDDFLLLAAFIILNNTDDILRLYKAVIVLETAALADPHQFTVRLWLVKLYLAIGCFKLARGHYLSLDIKSFQNETLSPYLYTRSSSLFPCNFIMNGDIYDQLPEFSAYTGKAFVKGVFTQIDGIIELHMKLRNSLTKRLLDIEQMKVERLLTHSVNTSSIVNTDPVSDDSLCDNRDSEGIWTIGQLSEIDIGPRPNKLWIKSQYLREKIIARLVGGDCEKQLEELRTCILEDDPKTRASLTEAELWSLEGICLLAENSRKKDNATTYKAIENYLKAIELHKFSSKESGKWLHNAFTYMELCRVIIGYVNRLRALKQVKFNVSAADSLASQVARTVSAIHQEALAIKNDRQKRSTTLINELKVWTKEYDLSCQIAENIVDSIGADQDEALTLLRNIKV